MNKYFLHSCKVNNLPDNGNAVIVSEMVENAQGVFEPNLAVIRNPKRTFYLTKPQYRSYNEKKETETLDRLDSYTVHDYEMNKEIFKALNGYYPKGYVDSRKLYDSPYLYGAGIQIEALIKAKYLDNFRKTERTVPLATTGVLDIERSVDPGTLDTINVLTVTHEHKVYTAINRFFFQRDVNGRSVPFEVRDVEDMIQTHLTPTLDRLIKGHKKLKHIMADKPPFEYYIQVCENEIDMIRWIFSKIHENKTSFVGVWNLGYDIPAILEALKKGDVDPREIFCDPNLKEEYKYFNFKEDTKEVDHPVLSWHWVQNTAHTQFIDNMCLFGRLRIVKGKESSYKLGDVLFNHGLEGKLYFSDIANAPDEGTLDWHRFMQAQYFCHYILYNQADVILVQLMEWLNKDVQAMVQLSDVTTLEKFARQTVRVTDMIQIDRMKDGEVLGTAGSNMAGPFDKEIGAVGGTVLDPNRMDECGLILFEDHPRLRAQVHPFVNDVDLEAMYPSTQQAANVSKQTKLNTALSITGHCVNRLYSPREAVDQFYGCMASLDTNSVRLATEFFNLPGFEEVDQLFQQWRESA